MTAFLFPGQGTQRPGMGRLLHDRYPEARRVFDLAGSVMDLDPRRLCFESRRQDLVRTELAQPALFVCNAAADAVARAQGVLPVAAAGHSVGEMSALVSSGALSFEDGLRAVIVRGRVMAEASAPGSMAAIVGLDPRDVAGLCDACRDMGVVVLGLVNAPTHCVVSGEATAVHECGRLAMARGALRVRMLEVSHAFHSPLLKAAQELWAKCVETLDIQRPQIPVALNGLGTLEHDPAIIRRELIEQFTGPVQWQACIRSLTAVGVESYLEVGDSRTLVAFNRMMGLSGVTRTVAQLCSSGRRGTWGACAVDEGFADERQADGR